jgi:hypothetical protein
MKKKMTKTQALKLQKQLNLNKKFMTKLKFMKR